MTVALVLLPALESAFVPLSSNPHILSHSQLAENLEEQDRTGLTLHVPPDPAQPPEAAAEAFVQEWQSGMR